MRKILITISFILFIYASNNALAQMTHGGIPYAFETKMSLPEFQYIDNSELYWIDSSNTKDCSAMEFARFLDVDFRFGDKSWTIEDLPNGDRLYRLGLQSEGAMAIGLYFKDFYLPTGSELFVYSSDYQEYYGAYNASNNTPSKLFSTEMIHGDEIILEFYEPREVRGMASMNIFEILHAYTVPQFDSEKDFGESGDCEINVNCPEGQGKGHQRDAVLRLLIKSGNSGIWCTGSLINNTRQDKTPYVLTADHCGKYSSDEDMLLWRFYFHYQSATCPNPEDEPENKSMLGCTMKAASMNTGELGSDFFLVELNEEIPSEYNPYFIGWNRDGSGSNSGYTIHHPQGDIKKISTYLQPLNSATYSTGITQGFWRVIWSETTSGHGVTEGGSSGSPIFDQNGYLIGTLTGGGASCSALTSPDYYGKFSLHWDENGDNLDEQLAPWLDPDNTGQLTLDGIYLDIDEVETSDESGFTLVPNPARTKVDIVLNENTQNVQVDLFQINGAHLHTYYFSGSSSINIASLPRGVYLIRVMGDQTTFVRRLIKE